MKVRVIEEGNEAARGMIVGRGVYRSKASAVRKARARGLEAVVIHFAACARMGTPEGWWVAVPKEEV